MFEQLSDKFRTLFATLSGKRSLTEENIAAATSEVRLALLDADVNYTVVKNFVKRVKEQALGDRVVKSVKPGEQFIQIVHEELVKLLGGGEATLALVGKPTVIMLCGLQGTGKTTQAAKLAHLLMKKEYGKKPLLVACDLARPAAIDQLERLAAQANAGVFALREERDPVQVARAALSEAKAKGHDVVILDTAGRLHVDETLMHELVRLKEELAPQEILFVTSAQVGQDAVKTALEFDAKLQITGTIFSMLDGNSRGGAAISIVEVTGRPIKFEGVGERIDDFQLFDARSMADRILGMGDTINLVKRAKEHFSEQEQAQLEQKLKQASFTYEDYLKQVQAVRKMGSLKKILSMMPMGDKLPNLDASEKEFRRIEAIILSMTPRERREKDELTPSRLKRIAKGSGAGIDEVNRLKKGFHQMKSFIKQASNRKMLDKMFSNK